MRNTNNIHGNNISELDMTINNIHVDNLHALICCQEWSKLGFSPVLGHNDMYEIQRIDCYAKFEDDEEAVIAAVKIGIRIIPVCELPENMPYRYFGYIDCQYNRDVIDFFKKKQNTGKKTYEIPVRFEGRVIYRIPADTEEEAMEKANEMAEEECLGYLEDIDWEVKHSIN